MKPKKLFQPRLQIGALDIWKIANLAIEGIEQGGEDVVKIVKIAERVRATAYKRLIKFGIDPTESVEQSPSLHCLKITVKGDRGCRDGCYHIDRCIRYGHKKRSTRNGQ